MESDRCTTRSDAKETRESQRCHGLPVALEEAHERHTYIVEGDKLVCSRRGAMFSGGHVHKLKQKCKRTPGNPKSVTRRNSRME